jgi:tRNA dimethylallyltransferase
MSLARARDQVIIETRQYVKRQRTWFRHQLPPDRTMHVNPESEGWERVVAEWWSATRDDAR